MITEQIRSRFELYLVDKFITCLKYIRVVNVFNSLEVIGILVHVVGYGVSIGPAPAERLGRFQTLRAFGASFRVFRPLVCAATR